MENVKKPEELKEVTDDDLKKVLYYALYAMGMYFEKDRTTYIQIDLKKEKQEEIKIKEEAPPPHAKKRKAAEIDVDKEVNEEEKIKRKVLEILEKFNYSVEVIKKSGGLTNNDMKTVLKLYGVNIKNENRLETLIKKLIDKLNPYYRWEKVHDIIYKDNDFKLIVKYVYHEDLEENDINDKENVLGLIASCFIEKTRNIKNWPIADLVDKHLGSLYFAKWDEARDQEQRKA